MKRLLLCSIPMLLLLLGIYHCSVKSKEAWNQGSYPPQIVIDIGHGGNDPGKVGINNALEKDINLAIGLYLEEYLTTSGYQVTLTRETDTSLADPDASNQKLSDLKNRVALMNRLGPSAVISIHQNSYPDKNVHGAQVFYGSSKESEGFATYVQSQLKRILNPNNKRTIKENPDYYLFRHTTCPIIIAECGFLSNYEEANLLITESYQRQIAWAIHMGTIQFLKSIERQSGTKNFSSSRFSSQ